MSVLSSAPSPEAAGAAPRRPASALSAAGAAGCCRKAGVAKASAAAGAAPPSSASSPGAAGAAAGAGSGSAAAPPIPARSPARPPAPPAAPPPRAAASSSCGSSSGAGAAAAYWPYACAKSAFSVPISGVAGAAGAGSGFGAGGAAGAVGMVAVMSTTLFKVMIAFSRMGSTWCKIFNRLSKSWIAGIILESDCIFEKTLTSGCESSRRVRIFFVSAFWMLLTAFFLACAAASCGFYLTYICLRVLCRASISPWSCALICTCCDTPRAERASAAALAWAEAVTLACMVACT